MSQTWTLRPLGKHGLGVVQHGFRLPFVPCHRQSEMFIQANLVTIQSSAHNGFSGCLYHSKGSLKRWCKSNRLTLIAVATA